MNFTVFNPGNKTPFTKRTTTVGIIAHHAAAVTLDPTTLVREHINRGFNGAGYNWYIRKDGTIYQLRPIDVCGAHTIGWNSKTIGICAEGNYQTVKEMPEVQQKAYAGVIDYCNDYYKTKLPVWPHKAKWPTACPGQYFPFAKIFSMAEHWDDKPVINYPGRLLKYTKPCMRGTDIRAVQQRLNDLNFPCGLTDGSYGPKTLAAVVKYQKAKGLKVDGKVGPATWAKLFN
jgi:N-acetylmuramoyl-L-alanine amidase